MNLFTFIAMCAIAAPPASADDAPMPPEEIRQSLGAKKAQLRKLQDEIQKLGGEIELPTKVRITLRVVEIDCVKLKQLNLAHPFGEEKGDPLTSFDYPKADFDGDEQLLRALNPVVEQGCAKVLASPSITTSIGQSVTVTNVRELPFPKVQEANGNKASGNQDDMAHVPGYRIEVLPIANADQEIRLSVKFRLNVEHPGATVLPDGTKIAPVDSKAIQSTIRLKPGKVVNLGGGKVNSREEFEEPPEKSGDNKKSIRVTHRVIETHYLVAAELLPQP